MSSKALQVSTEKKAEALGSWCPWLLPTHFEAGKTYAFQKELVLLSFQVVTQEVIAGFLLPGATLVVCYSL